MLGAMKETDIRLLFEAYIDALDSGDTRALRALHHPDAVLVHMNGHRASLDEWIRGIRAGEFVYHRIEVHTFQVTPYGFITQVTTGITDDGSGHPWPLRIEVDVKDNRITASRVFYNG